MRGSRFRGLDRFYLWIFSKFIQQPYAQKRNYEWIHYFFPHELRHLDYNGLLHIDDPSYSDEERRDLLRWESSFEQVGKLSVIVVTNPLTKKWVESFVRTSKVVIVEQGFTKVNEGVIEKFKNFSCVYSSPFIDYKSDKHAKHITWGSELLIEEIIPRISEIDSSIDIHLIGRVGKDAQRELQHHRNVIIHGHVSSEENAKILRKCHLGLYPRSVDNFRRVLKIYEYIGAGLPIVTFDLEDTRPVKEERLGYSVSRVEDFVQSVVNMKRNNKIYLAAKQNVFQSMAGRSWQEHAERIDKLHLEGIESI